MLFPSKKTAKKRWSQTKMLVFENFVFDISFLETVISVATYKASYKQKCKFYSISLRGYSPVRIILWCENCQHIWVDSLNICWHIWMVSLNICWHIWMVSLNICWHIWMVSLNICWHILMVSEYLLTHLNGLSEYLPTHLNGLWISADTSEWSLWISADTSEWSLNICWHIWMVSLNICRHIWMVSEYLMTHLNGVYEYIFHPSVLLYWQWVTEASEGWTLIQSCVINKCDFHFLYALFLYINVTESARDNNIEAKTHED